MSEKQLQQTKAQQNIKVSGNTGNEWNVQKRAQQMTRRFDFSSYDEMRDFLDQLEELSESEAYFPDLTFSRTHVNVAIKSRGDELTQVDVSFSEKVNALVTPRSSDRGAK